MMDALTMGAYGPYVWSCFGLTLVVLIICTVQARKHHQQVFNEIRTRIRAMDVDS